MVRPAAESAATADHLYRAIARLIGDDAAAGDRFGIAVSGGADSLALLLLAATALPGRIAAATVDHRLRAAGADEARFVAALCAQRNIPHHILTADGPPSGSVQAAARTLRYALLDDWRTAHRIEWLLTAHHADDQAETLVMRLNRASGLAGLAGVRPRNGHVLRPLLNTRRADLLTVVRTAGIVPVDDPSNHDPHYDRTRVRDQLAQSALLDPLAVSRSAAWLADANDALDWAVTMAAANRLSHKDEAVELDTSALPNEIVRRLILRALMAMGLHTQPRSDAMLRVIATVRGGEQAMIGNLIVRPDHAVPAIWHIMHAPNRSDR